MKIADTLSEVVDILFPRVCSVCGRALIKGEDIMCLHCLLNLPRVTLHSLTDNEIHINLMSMKTHIDKAASLFYYIRDTDYTNLIKDAKYRSRPSIGRKLARMFAAELVERDFFDGIDMIVPMPIHFTKMFTRGYNQTYHMALGISDVTLLPVAELLKMKRMHPSQTRKGASQRAQNAIDEFAVTGDEPPRGSHLLVIDDVITTGATMMSALDTLRQAYPHVKLSLLSLALTKLQ